MRDFLSQHGDAVLAFLGGGFVTWLLDRILDRRHKALETRKLKLDVESAERAAASVPRSPEDDAERERIYHEFVALLNGVGDDDDEGTRFESRRQAIFALSKRGAFILRPEVHGLMFRALSNFIVLMQAARTYRNPLAPEERIRKASEDELAANLDLLEVGKLWKSAFEPYRRF